MEIRKVKNVFGNTPIQNLPAAQLMQQKTDRNKQIAIGMAVCLVTGAIIGIYIANSYFKSEAMSYKSIAELNRKK